MICVQLLTPGRPPPGRGVGECVREMDELEGLEPALGSVTRNIVIRGRRTSVRMEAAFWDGLAEIAQREGLTLNDLCEKIDDARLEGGNLTSAIRVFVQSYFAMLALRSTRGGAA